MAFKNMEELERGIAASGQNWSEADKALAKKNIGYGNSLYGFKKDWVDATARGDTAAAQRSHDQAEAFRRRYGGYSGGTDGSDYIKDGTYFTYDDPYADALGQLADSILSYESFENPYRKQAEQVLSEYIDRGPFSYGLDSDPVWQQYQKTYLREGQRAREDTLGNYAAATGGQASTAAVYAASQAQDYYNAQMADKVPELYGQAYDRWLDEGEQYTNQIDALRAMGSDAMQEWNANRTLLKDQFSSIRDLSDSLYDRDYRKWTADYQVGRDRLDDSRYAEELAYSREEDAANRAWKQQQAALDQAIAWLKMGVAPDNAVTEAAGLSEQDVGRYLGAVQAQLAAKGSKRSSGGGSSGSPSSGSSGAPDYEGLFRDAYNSGHAENYIATNYKKYGFSKSTGLSKEYHAAYDEDFESLLDETRRMVDANEYDPSAAVAHLKAKGYDDETAARVTGAIWRR